MQDCLLGQYNTQYHVYCMETMCIYLLGQYNTTLDEYECVGKRNKDAHLSIVCTTQKLREHYYYSMLICMVRAHEPETTV